MALRLNTGEKNEIIDIMRHIRRFFFFASLFLRYRLLRFLVFGFWFLGTPSHLGTKQYTIPRVGESNPFMEPTTPNQPAATSASAWDGSKKIDHKDFMQFVSTLRKSAMSPDTIESLQRLLMDDVGLSPGRRSCKSFGTSQPALNCADITADAVIALRGY